MNQRVLRAFKVTALFIFLLLPAYSAHSWVLFDVYRYNSTGETQIIGHLFIALSNTGFISEFQPSPRGQTIQQNQDPFSALTSIPSGGFPHIHASVCSQPETKLILSTSISFAWPRHMSSTQFFLIGQIPSSPQYSQYRCQYFTNNNGRSTLTCRDEGPHINLWLLLETLIRNAPDQTKANGYNNILLHVPLLLQGLFAIQATGPDLQIQSIAYTYDGATSISINTIQGYLIEVGYTQEVSSHEAGAQITCIKISYNGVILILLLKAPNQLPKQMSNTFSGGNFPPDPSGGGAGAAAGGASAGSFSLINSR